MWCAFCNCDERSGESGVSFSSCANKSIGAPRFPTIRDAKQIVDRLVDLQLSSCLQRYTRRRPSISRERQIEARLSHHKYSFWYRYEVIRGDEVCSAG